MHTIFTASAVLTAALTSAHNFTRGLTGLSPLLLTHSGITPSTIQQPSSGSSGQRFVVCFESDQLKMQTGSATANGAELEPAGLTRTRSAHPLVAERESADDLERRALHERAVRGRLADHHLEVLPRARVDAVRRRRELEGGSHVALLQRGHLARDDVDGRERGRRRHHQRGGAVERGDCRHINVEAAKRAVRFDGAAKRGAAKRAVPIVGVRRQVWRARPRPCGAFFTKERYVARFYASLPPPTRIPR